jgi:hypothetical protein
MALSNPIFSNSGAATFLDARNDMAGLIVQDTGGLTRPGILWASQDQLVTGRNDLMLDVADFNASLERHGSLLIANRGTAQVAIAAAPAANSRIDVVYVLQRETQAPMSDATAGPVFGVVQGVAAAVPVVPTSLPDGALQLATVRMPAGASTTLSSGVVISQTYPYTTCNGGVIPMRSTDDLATWNAVEYQRARLADGTEYVRRNGVWVSQTRTRIYQGSKVMKLSNSTGVQVLSDAELTSMLGHAWNNGDTGICMNGDRKANQTPVSSSDYDAGFNARFANPVSGSMRINWIVVDSAS